MTLDDARERLFEIDLLDAKQFCRDTREKLRAFDTRILKRTPLFRLERVDLSADHRARALRRGELRTESTWRLRIDRGNRMHDCKHAWTIEGACSRRTLVKQTAE